MRAIGILALCAGAAWGACGDRAGGESMLVSGEWLAAHLRDSNLVVLAIGDEGEYAAGHIPGARFLPYMDTHSMTSPGGLSVELLPMPELEKNFGRLGVSNDSRVILYFTAKTAITYATRTFLTLDAMGMGAQTSMLDGGFAAWKSEGRAVTTEVPKAAPGKLKACPRPEVIADLDYVKGHVKTSDVQIIDARLPQFYTGAQQPSGQRLGHIPGSTNLPYVSLFDDQGKMKSRDTVAAAFTAAGVTKGKQMVSYCHIGQQATAVYFVARYLGFDARMYDGSWEEWSKHTELPNEVSEGKK